jgi:cysteine-rich repeat protein
VRRRQLNKTAGEQCDDGNVAEGDGCSSTCKSHKVVFATSTAFDGCSAASTAPT